MTFIVLFQFSLHRYANHESLAKSVFHCKTISKIELAAFFNLLQCNLHRGWRLKHKIYCRNQKTVLSRSALSNGCNITQ